MAGRKISIKLFLLSMVVSCWGQEFQSTSINTQPQIAQGTRPLNAATTTVEQSRSRVSHATQANKPTPAQLNFQKSVRDAVERRVKQQQKEALLLPDTQQQIRSSMQNEATENFVKNTQFSRIEPIQKQRLGQNTVQGQRQASFQSQKQESNQNNVRQQHSQMDQLQNNIRQQGLGSSNQFQQQPLSHSSQIPNIKFQDKQSDLIERQQHQSQKSTAQNRQVQQQHIQTSPIENQQSQRSPVQVDQTQFTEQRTGISKASDELSLLQEQEEMTRRQAENAKYTFSSSVEDGIMDNNHVRQETRDGLKLTGLYSYSDGFYMRTVHYEADDQGYRVTKEDIIPIGDGPQVNLDGRAKVNTNIAGVNNKYSITAADIASLSARGTQLST